MSLLYPDIHLNSVCDITKKILEQKKISGLIIDVDNTLTSQDGFHISAEIENWLEETKQHTSCILVSNNKKKRVEDFAKQVGLPSVYFALKPIPFFGLAMAVKKIGKKANEVAVVGDQLFTDVMGANLLGAISIRIEPVELSQKQAKSFKRKLEAKITSNYLKKGEIN